MSGVALPAFSYGQGTDNGWKALKKLRKSARIYWVVTSPYPSYIFFMIIFLNLPITVFWLFKNLTDRLFQPCDPNWGTQNIYSWTIYHQLSPDATSSVPAPWICLRLNREDCPLRFTALSPYIYPHIGDFFVDNKRVDVFGHGFGKFQTLLLAFWYGDEERWREKYELEPLLRSV